MLERRSAGAICMDDPAAYGDVDLVIPVGQLRYLVPAWDRSLAPHLLQFRSWEPHLTRFFENELRPRDTFIDVGANVGYFTVLAAARVQRVVAFEPAVRAHRYCTANIALNGLTNVELLPCGLWEKDASLPLSGERDGINSVVGDVDGWSHETIRVVALDSLVRSGELALSRLDFVKLDIEGAELEALAGMRETLARFRPTIVMEVNRPMLALFRRTATDVWEFFAGQSYHLRVFEHWQPRDPIPAPSLDHLERLCVADGPADIVATPAA
jgi:FkbM family methyltransferase